ncbi:hypothetical protein V6N13_020640 [Hibiscus sabdariffa]|uniref:Uncharacterized protein n=1 Tax=Hibiscus sabdariffa TaxID=183260 RepID=A0ABR2EU29_9ROSI
MRVTSSPASFKVGKSTTGSNMKGSQGKANFGYRSPNKMSMSEWIQAASERIDVMVNAESVMNRIGIWGMEEEDPGLGLQNGDVNDR